MPVYNSKAEARRRAVQVPSDVTALIASEWPPYSRARLGPMTQVLRRAATLPKAIGPSYFMSRIQLLVALLRKRTARHATSKFWTVTAPNGRPIRLPLGDPDAVAFKKMCDEYGTDYEAALIRYVSDRVGPGDVFVDVGAHVGYISGFAAAAGATAFAIEIQRELIPLIEQFASINDFDTLRVLHAGASQAPGLGMISRMDTTPGAGFTSTTQRINTDDPHSIADDFVPMITLDDAFGRDRLWPAVVKVDVEGHEVAVVAGARNIIARGRTSFVIEYHPHLVAMYRSSGDQLLDAFPVDRWHRYQLTDDGLRRIDAIAEVTPDPRDPNPKLVFEPRGVYPPA